MHGVLAARVGVGARSGRLDWSVVEVWELDAATRASMWLLFQRHYELVTRATFDADLARKHLVCLLRDTGDASVCGFSTVELIHDVDNGKRSIILYSGDTIVDPDYWGQTSLQLAFLWICTRLTIRHPATPLYWFLICKGYRTYLLLARNVPAFWPRHGSADSREAALLNRLAQAKFADSYDAASSVARFSQCPGRLRPNVAPIRPTMLDDPDIRFFVERNPGHALGDELCCIARMDVLTGLRTIAKYASRTLARGWRS